MTISPGNIQQRKKKIFFEFRKLNGIFLKDFHSYEAIERFRIVPATYGAIIVINNFLREARECLFAPC